MRRMLLLAAMVLLAGCSPTTDITRTSTEGVAGRTWYQVVGTTTSGDALHVELKVSSLAAARIVAEDVAVKMRAPYERVEVDVFGPANRVGGRPASVLTWSTREGFHESSQQPVAGSQ